MRRFIQVFAFVLPLAVATVARGQDAELEPGEKAPESAEAPAEGDPGGEWEAVYRAPEDAEAEVISAAAREERDFSGEEREPDQRLLHGFRLGYGVLMNAYADDPNQEGKTVAESYGLDSPYLFLLGYEVFYRLVGHSWLNVILVGNVTVAGLEQSTVLPSANGLLGFEFNESFQLGVGINLMPDEDKASHMIAAAGWTPRVGSFYVPVHFHFIPDVDQNHRAGVTLGINW